MYRLDQFERQKNYLKSLMPFACIIDPGLVINKNGSLQTTFRYRGPDLDSAVEEQLGVMTAQLNNAFDLLGTGAVLYLEAQRLPSTAYERGVHFPDPVTAAIDEKRYQQFSTGLYYESNYYLTLLWMPPNDQEGRLREFMIEGRKRKLINGEDHIQFFIDQVEKLFRTFKNLKVPVEWLSPDEIATYLHSTVSSKAGNISLPTQPVLLDQLLYDVPIAVGLEPGLMLGNKHVRVITPTKYLSMSQFGIFNDLNRLNFPYRWVSRYFCLDKQEAISALNNMQKSWSGKIKSWRTMIGEIWTGRPSPEAYNENAMLKAGEAKAAEQLTELDEVGYGFYSTMFVVQDENLETVEEKAKAIEQVFLQLGMRVKTEDFNAFDAWLGSIPGNVSRHIRRPLVSTGNFVHMTPLTDIWSGPERNDHWDGPALLYTQTVGNTQFRFNPFIDDVGHTLLVGRTGSGKSVLLNELRAQCRKYYDAQVIIFDKGASSRVLTEAVGGKFYDIANEGSELSFQPLAQIDDEKERRWAQDWLCDYMRQENVTITPTVKQLVWTALESMTSLETKYRTISTLVSSIQDKAIKTALTPLTIKGAYGRIFDSDCDTLRFANWQAFEMETIMNTPNIISPTLMYIFHRIEQQLTGRPTVIDLDEMWVFLKNPLFAEKIREWLKVLRKANAFVIFATQNLDDLEDSPVFSTALESCLTRIFLPNDKALEKKNLELYTSFGLNLKQIQIIAGAIPRKQYYYVSPKGARLFNLDLDPLELSYVAVNKADIEECKRLINEYGREEFVERWKKYKNVA